MLLSVGYQRRVTAYHLTSWLEIQFEKSNATFPLQENLRLSKRVEPRDTEQLVIILPEATSHQSYELALRKCK
jgi:hypothetical protein